LKRSFIVSLAWYDWILAVASTAPGIYIIMNYDQIMMRIQGVIDN